MSIRHFLGIELSYIIKNSTNYEKAHHESTLTSTFLVFILRCELNFLFLFKNNNFKQFGKIAIRHMMRMTNGLDNADLDFWPLLKQKSLFEEDGAVSEMDKKPKAKLQSVSKHTTALAAS